MIDAYPLHWPVGYSTTPDYQRKNSLFKQTMEGAQRFLRDEIARLGGRELIVSTNLPLRQDGMLYADWMKKKISNPGAAIYFKYKGKDIAMCCDQYRAVWENIYALGKGIEALRGMERWGVSDFLDRAFTGFKALPESTMSEQMVWKKLDLPSKPYSLDMVHAAYKSQAKKVHPDVAGGSTDAFNELQHAYKLAQQFFQN